MLNKTCLAALAISGTVHALLLLYATFPVSQSAHKAVTPVTLAPLHAVLISPLPSLAENASASAMDAMQENEVKSEPVAAQPDQGNVGNSGGLANYYPAKALSRMPQPITNLTAILTAYGEPTARGKVSIRLWINRSGGLDRLSVVSSELPQSLEETVVAAFSQMQFIPGEIDGVAVMSWVDVVVEYGDLVGPASPALPGNDKSPDPAPVINR